MLQPYPIKTDCSPVISYSFKGSKTKTIDLEMSDYLKIAQLDPTQRDRFVIEKILHEEKINLTSTITKQKFIPLYHKKEAIVSNSALAQQHEISDIYLLYWNYKVHNKNMNTE